MNLEYSGTIPVPVDDAWGVLSDLERVAGCLPGIRLDQVGPDQVAGTVTVPLGPLRLTYRGEATFVERDLAARRVVIDASGRDSHGQQAASARVTVQLREADGGTHVAALADVNVRGMAPPVGFAVREFGTGMLREFVTRIAAARHRTPRRASEPTPSGAAPAPSPDAPEPSPAAAEPVTTESGADVPTPKPTPRPRPAHSPAEAVYPVPPPGEGIEVPAAVGQYAPYAGALAVGALLGWLVGRRRRR